MKRVIFFVLLINVSLLSFPQNLIVNPGFETWEKLNKPAGWTTAQSCLKDSVDINSGNYSCRHDGGTKYLGQTLTVAPGKQYRLTFFYKTAITGTGNGCRIWCYWKDSAGNNLTDVATDNILRPSKYLKSDTWQQFSIDIASIAGTAFFYLEIRTYANSIAWLDDFVFEENVSTYSPEEKDSGITIYPNPANDYLTVSSMTGLKHIYIQSLTGIIIWSSDFSAEGTVTIPVSGLPNGMYIIRIHAADKIITRKFVKRAN
jgi:hypothetical protein